MDVLSTHAKVVEDYAKYIQSFLNIADPEIHATVEARLSEGRLWPEPLLQFNPAFESAGTVAEVAATEGAIYSVNSEAKLEVAYALIRKAYELAEDDS
jgi:hypothetical protein